MKTAYPVVFSEIAEGYLASVPDFDIDTHGSDIAAAIAMARDAIGVIGIDMQDDGKPLPAPSDPASVKREHGEIVSLVDIDFAEYRRKNDLRTIRRNVSLPTWLNAEAERAGLNVSAVLRSALKSELGISA
ncbi:MAG: type II toxin-antitoxin system HicB family antitoxin [Oscillospiraceae bacterium]|jgi:predicted RNase H-like HicB family nuclease|nr:type II toxin-antitoxin system HicB family antitoxin [Oscillospiraceae bacterium]